MQIKRKLPRTWSYKIMGNKHSGKIYNLILDKCSDYLTEEQQKENSQELEQINYIPYEAWCKVAYKWYRINVNQGLDELIEFIRSFENRLAFQVLGFFVMQVGAEMPEKLKQLILENSKWEDDEPYLWEKEHQEERKNYLADFRDRTENYKSGMPDSELKRPDHDYMCWLPPIDHFNQKLGSVEEIVKKNQEILNRVRKKPPKLKSFISQLKSLLEKTYSEGHFLDEGLIQYKGFTFILRDINEVPKELQTDCSFEIQFGKSDSNDFQISNNFDIRLIGSLKTIIPNLVIGGGDGLFGAWLLVKTPNGKIFPAEIEFYRFILTFRSSRYLPRETTMEHAPNEFRETFNSSPYDLTEEALKYLIDSLEKSLLKIPPSDYSAKHKWEQWKETFGIKNEIPFPDYKAKKSNNPFDDLFSLK